MAIPDVIWPVWETSQAFCLFIILTAPSSWCTCVLAVVVRMFRVDYGKVNQGQSSDLLALFRPSKAYSSLFSQYSLTSISTVSPDKPLCVCACVWCVCGFERVIRCKDFRYANDTFTFSAIWIQPTHIWGRWVLLSTSCLRGYFEEAQASGSLPTHACKWQNITGLLILTIKSLFWTCVHFPSFDSRLFDCLNSASTPCLWAWAGADVTYKKIKEVKLQF